MNMEMDMETETKNSNMEITISIKPDETMPPFPNPNPHSAQVHNYPGMLYLIYAATLVYMFPSMINLVELKFQNKERSVFETHGVFAYMAVVAYIISVPMSVALFCWRARFESLKMKSLSLIYYNILQSLFYFSSILAPLSFVLVLFSFHGLDLIAYSLVFTLFLAIVACSFSNYIFKKDAPN
ncbi:uncharacterized protein LOC110903139 isoform X2 [Helianthus annuus]|nr:uncharacterized protein LOC110903139 isoform X2 [Helianthus annuus]